MAKSKRKSRQKSRQHKESNSRMSYSDFVVEVYGRLDRLERTVFALENSDFFQHANESRKPGKKKAMSDAAHLEARDKLVYFLEVHWPELRVAINKARSRQNPELLKTAFLKAVEERRFVFMPEFAEHPERYTDQLWSFLTSKRERYFNNPRNIANAMAGMPHMSWKTSFDKGSSNPSRNPISDRAIPDYLRRKVPDRYRALKRAKSINEVMTILAKRSNDPHIRRWRKNPETVWQMMRKSQPEIRSGTRVSES